MPGPDGRPDSDTGDAATADTDIRAVLALIMEKVEQHQLQLDHLRDLVQVAVYYAARADSTMTRTEQRLLYDAAAAVAAEHPTAGKAGLGPFERKVFSQNGEDGVLAAILNRLGPAVRPYFVEFGAERGLEGNCILLADVLGWPGLLIEAADECFEALHAKYDANERVATLHASVSADNIDRLLRDIGVPNDFGVLSIDIDGQDWWVWRAVESHRPAVVVIEYNSALDPSTALVQPYDPEWISPRTDYFGCSLGALLALADAKGYRLVHTELTGVNAFFVRADIAAPFMDDSDPPRRRPNLLFQGHGHVPAPGAPVYVDARAVLGGDGVAEITRDPAS